MKLGTKLQIIIHLNSNYLNFYMKEINYYFDLLFNEDNMFVC